MKKCISNIGVTFFKECVPLKSFPMQFSWNLLCGISVPLTAKKTICIKYRTSSCVMKWFVWFIWLLFGFSQKYMKKYNVWVKWTNHFITHALHDFFIQNVFPEQKTAHWYHIPIFMKTQSKWLQWETFFEKSTAVFRVVCPPKNSYL
jgi:hypothetical protein